MTGVEVGVKLGVWKAFCSGTATMQKQSARRITSAVVMDCFTIRRQRIASPVKGQKGCISGLFDGFHGTTHADDSRGVEGFQMIGRIQCGMGACRAASNKDS